MKSAKVLCNVLFNLLIMVFFAVAAEAETVNCTPITALPFTISTPGIYCLNNDLQVNGGFIQAIIIDADNVVVDLNGHKINNMATDHISAMGSEGIFSSCHRNITIKNGIVSGFDYGVRLTKQQTTPIPTGNVIENIHADRNYSNSLWTDGNGNIIRNNVVTNTSGVNDAYGIRTYGSNNQVVNNDVYGTVEAGPGFRAFGIRNYGGSGNVIENNRVGNSALGSGISYGIYETWTTKGSIIVNNRISNMNYGISYESNTSGTADGKNRDNLTTNVDTPYVGGTDIRRSND